MKQNFDKSFKELEINKVLFSFFNDEKITEIFKDIPNYKGQYQISNFGRIKSLQRNFIRKNGKRFTVKEKILKQTFDGKGYLTIKLYKRKKLKNIKVHVLLAIVFKNHQQTGTTKIVVDHIDNIKTNNFDWNLQLITHRENCTKDIKDKTSIYPGVSWSKNAEKWRASISINGKIKHLGLFKIEEKASEAYQKALKQSFA